MNTFWLMVMLFIFGGIMLILELMLPGFGIAGIIGIIALVAGIVVGSSVLAAGQLAVAILIVFIAIVVMVILIYRSATKNGKISRSLFLHSKADKEEGYTSTRDYQDMLGKEGIAIAPLRPSGTGDFDGVKLDVVTEGQFIPKGTRIKIINVEGFRILVEKIDNTIEN